MYGMFSPIEQQRDLFMYANEMLPAKCSLAGDTNQSKKSIFGDRGAKKVETKQAQQGSDKLMAHVQVLCNLNSLVFN